MTTLTRSRVDVLLLNDAQQVLATHRPGPTGRCDQLHCHGQLWPCIPAATARRAAALARGRQPAAPATRWAITRPGHQTPPTAQMPARLADVLDTLYWFPSATVTAIARRCRTSTAALRHTLAELRHHGLVQAVTT
ncbi:hypothetical protein HDA40_002145 [Hamadaea flava]|uniref:Helix-turn-helix domain-containing protein n=1 Tax=Hamadaea flava TaxID=1742688 RepID=A0ABV8LLJ3_9ACTN|nr:helix-turn-helix domain-containing protein [Hamadaea flava]MCP2323638.1 hypothetical protein [Hamadaea flava]